MAKKIKTDLVSHHFKLGHLSNYEEWKKNANKYSPLTGVKGGPSLLSA